MPQLDWEAEIHACGYFPDLVTEAVRLALGGEELLSHLVHQEATFNREELKRHLSVLALTPTRLIVAHTDEGEDAVDPPQALTTTESVPLRQVKSVSLSQVVSRPEGYGSRGSQIAETWLSVSWGTMRRVDVEPAHCGDPDCDADHGLTGVLAGDDLTVRISAAADGSDKVAQLIAFATKLQQVSGRIG